MNTNKDNKGPQNKKKSGLRDGLDYDIAMYLFWSVEAESDLSFGTGQQDFKICSLQRQQKFCNHLMSGIIQY